MNLHRPAARVSDPDEYGLFVKHADDGDVIEVRGAAVLALARDHHARGLVRLHEVADANGQRRLRAERLRGRRA